MEQRKFFSWNNEKKMLFFEGNNGLTKQFSRRDNETMNTLYIWLLLFTPILIRVNPVYRRMASPQILEDPLISSE